MAATDSRQSAKEASADRPAWVRPTQALLLVAAVVLVAGAARFLTTPVTVSFTYPAASITPSGDLIPLEPHLVYECGSLLDQLRRAEEDQRCEGMGYSGSETLLFTGVVVGLCAASIGLALLARHLAGRRV